MIEVVVSDWGGVLTNPLWDGFAAVNERLGIAPQQLGEAMAAAADALGFNVLHALERGEMTADGFLDAVDEQLSASLGRPAGFHDFPELYWGALRSNEAVIDALRAFRARGYRLALLTNNVREWEPYWRAMLPVDELFELVVDSGFVGVRKPEAEIYAITCSRLGVAAGACVLLDDFAVNCDGAREAGMRAVEFRDTAQALGELGALLAAEGAHG